ncbi:hypothetical protein G6F31_020609 [Rhizopus arrhizus]|nr:hypothetical protein G6F31_020609 [Rhizopus arrhizus]
MAAAFLGGMQHVDRNLLTRAAAQMPEFGRSQSGSGHAGLRRRANRKGRGQHRVRAARAAQGQPDIHHRGRTGRGGRRRCCP